MNHVRFVDDLLWVVNSPPLVRSTWRPVPPLSRAAIDRGKLAGFVSDQNSRRVGPHRVGQYFEDLVHFYLMHHAETHAIRRGLQIRHEARTIGELDFVYREADSRAVHLETAVKFYLHLPAANPIGSHYIGPNAKDTLERKVHRLVEHQLPMSDHPHARQSIFAGTGRIEKKAWVCGRIFYHPDHGESQDPSPLLSDEHLRGTWLRESELGWLDRERRPFRFGVLEKPNWLSGRGSAGHPHSAAGMAAQIRAHFARRRRPVMIGEFDATRPTHVIRQIMVVSDTWPLQE